MGFDRLLRRIGRKIKQLTLKYSFASRKSYALKQLESHGILQLLDSGRSEEIAFQPLDCWRLYCLIRKKRPKVVLELGVGFSTIIIAEALKRNEDELGIIGRLWTVDAEIKWLENTKRKLKDYHLQRCTFLCSECSLVEVDFTPVACFDNLPDISPDFIYVDGPNYDSVRGVTSNGLTFKTRDVIHIEPLKYEMSAPSTFTILIDGRWRTGLFLKKYLKRDYRSEFVLHDKYILFQSK
jgi:hypothetical protein